MDALTQGTNALFILLGAIMVLAMHAGFAFLELGTVRKKNQVNALVKILVDFSVSTVVYFLVGYGVAYGTHFFVGADELARQNGYELVKFFFLLTFAGAIPAKAYTVEPTGDVTFVQAFLSGAIVNISVSPNIAVTPDEPIWLEFDQERVHLFDSETEMALEAS